MFYTRPNFEMNKKCAVKPIQICWIVAIESIVLNKKHFKKEITFFDFEVIYDFLASKIFTALCMLKSRTVSTFVNWKFSDMPTTTH